MQRRYTTLENISNFIIVRSDKIPLLLLLTDIKDKWFVPDSNDEYM